MQILIRKVVARKKLIYLFVFIITLLLFASAAHAEFNPDNSLSLKGLVGVYVLVEKIPESVSKAGLTPEDIRLDIEKRLRKAGIPVLSRQEFVGAPGAPRIYFQVNAAEYEGKYLWSSRKFAFSVRLELGQLATLSRDKNKEFYVTTWQTGAVGYSDAEKLVAIKDDILELVDRFIKAWNEAGGK